MQVGILGIWSSTFFEGKGGEDGKLAFVIMR